MTDVLVTALEYRKGEAVFAAAVDDGFRCVPVSRHEAELASTVKACSAAHVVVGVDSFVGPLYDALPRGAVIARFGIGHDGVNKQRATARGILCTNTPGVLDDSVAEHAIALLLSAARSVPQQSTSVRAGEWKPMVGCELRGKRLAVIGCGAIGCRVARIASFGFGMDVVGCDVRSLDVGLLRREFGFVDVVAEFADAVADADFVSLHLPSIPATKHFVNRSRLMGLPRGAWLINTARGAIVDEVALYEALTEKRVAGAALDVMETEPYVPARPDADLRVLPNTILTPHVGSCTREACNRMAQDALKNIRLARDARFAEMSLLNPEVIQTCGSQAQTAIPELCTS